MAADPSWVRRFSAPEVRFPRWAIAAPDRLAAVSSADGSPQVWSFGPGGPRRLSAEPIGVWEAHPTPDGRRVAWWRDATGDERGRWVAAPWEGGPAEELLPGVPEGWSMGLSFAPGVTAAAIADETGYAVHVAVDGRPPSELLRTDVPLGVGREWPEGDGGLSADGELLCLRLAQEGDIERWGLRVLDPRTGRVVADLADPGRSMQPAAWSPRPGDPRLAVVHERSDRARPALWDPTTGAWEDLDPGLPGDVDVAGWWPDASALLLRHDHDGVDALHRMELADRRLEPVAAPGGTITGAGVRPDGAVWFRAETSAAPPRIVDDRGRVVVAAPGEPAPAGRPYRSLRFRSADGWTIHGFVVTPSGPGPHPMVLRVHGGPASAWREAFDPEIQALVDHGYAVAMVNYRGSSGYGVRFREALRGDIGFPETRDLLAGLDALVAEGLVDPARVAIAGRSWGGYLTLLALGLHPDRWRAGVGIVPVGDYVAAHYECSPPLRAWDLAMLGGSPEDLPALYEERNPMTYVDRVRAPALVIVGENDSRCPLGQAMRWVVARRARGGAVEVYRYRAGHSALQVDERIRQMDVELAFLARTIPPPTGRVARAPRPA
ncbi:MAG TPA: prolyl oligopeptidase family serine peptidase [Actinomycetota bacterium]|nr:prolyl oligopeptidase family serine peptidase [Actinomycetota bacterium]